MALGFSATLSTRKRLFFLPRPLEIERVLHALESIQNEDFGIPDLAEQRRICSAARPTFTASYLAEDGFLIVDFGGEAKIFFAVRDRDLYAEYVTTTLFGPGFHVLALRFCERLAETAGLKLQIDDETDYYRNRDFASLKQSFVRWFGMLLQTVEPHDMKTGVFRIKEFSGKQYAIYYFMRYDVAYLGKTCATWRETTSITATTGPAI